MKRRIQIIVLIVVSSLLLTGHVMGQRVSFGLFATEDIVLTPLGLGELNFNSKQPLLLAGESVTINLVDDETAILTITGRRDQEITVTLEGPGTLDLDASNKIPLALKFAYSNNGAPNEVLAKQSAVEMITGFNSATFPILKRTAGLPAPPPTPGHSGYVAPLGTVYLFIYGNLGAVPANAAPGSYTGDINIHVSYSVN